MRFIFLIIVLLQPARLWAQADSPASPSIKEVNEEEEANIFRYRDIYFLTGNPDTKIQLSLKLQLFEDVELYFGYSQVMFWKLFTERSSPFHDVAYNPELFYTFTLGEDFWRYLSVGLEHRSNGKAGKTSRSFDRAFAQLDNAFDFGSAEFKWSLRLFAFYNKGDENADIRKFLGFWETRLAVSSLFEDYLPSKTELYVSFFPGSDYTRNLFNGGTELGLKFRVRLFGIMPYLMVQYYYGNAESLIDYDKSARSFRAGFLL